MKQGVLTNARVRLLMTPGDQGFRGYGRRKGELLAKNGVGAQASRQFLVGRLRVTVALWRLCSVDNGP